MRTPIMAGNWKMFKTAGESLTFLQALIAEDRPQDVETVLCAPFLSLDLMAQKAEGTGISIGAQNVHQEPEGAFTGEVSVPMLQACQIPYVIIGHSERRTYFAETDVTVHQKTRAALAGGLTPIVCVGEQLKEREAGETQNVVSDQVTKALQGISAVDVQKGVLAYEPVWAIGSGKASTAQDAEEVCGWIRQTLSQLFGDSTAELVRIQYGGSVKPNNVAEFMAEPNIDGALVGGASLDVAAFLQLVRAASPSGERA